MGDTYVVVIFRAGLQSFRIRTAVNIVLDDFAASILALNSLFWIVYIGFFRSLLLRAHWSARLHSIGGQKLASSRVYTRSDVGAISPLDV